MPYKVFNPDPVDVHIKINDVLIDIPAKGYAIVDSVVGVQEHCASLEVTPSSDKDYADYRVALAKKQKENEKLAIEKAKHDAEVIKLEAKNTEKKIKAQQAIAEAQRIAATEIKLGSISREKSDYEKAEETIVVNTAYSPTKVAAPKGKKGKK